ncbi:hypothetical protein Ahy_A09g043706 [Arachis hypogaea]|uniref:Auxin-induced protein n=1 Tax=Arachis hypogaea TaxID=3818 RepID=A0A445BIW2_ARAHY|nr:hypothetical protein Ahy_A09g043706 [Arachis hypogaea]
MSYANVTLPGLDLLNGISHAEAWRCTPGQISRRSLQGPIWVCHTPEQGCLTREERGSSIDQRGVMFCMPHIGVSTCHGHILFCFSDPLLCLINLIIGKSKPQVCDSSSSPPLQALIGIWNDLEEISGSFKNSLSLLSSNKAITGISKLASQLLQLEPNHKWQSDVDGDGDVVPGTTEEVVRFVKEISMRPDCWIEFPLPFHPVEIFKEKVWTTFPPEGSKYMPPYPSAKFKWKDYCPVVFRAFRKLFKVDPADYMLSICGNEALRELCSPGKSGSFFYLTNDDRYMIKTMKKAEVKALLRMLPAYYTHFRTYQNIMVTKYYGLHCVKLTGHIQRKVHFLYIMGNLFRSKYNTDRHYDLKGSSLGRTTNKLETKLSETTILKDLDLNFIFQLQSSRFEEFCSDHNKFFVKVYMEGISISRILNSLVHDGYHELVKALEQMFDTTILLQAERCHVLTYEDEEGDLIMVGDVPWEILYDKQFNAFHYLVSDEDAPNYRSIIQNPMDMAIVLHHVDNVKVKYVIVFHTPKAQSPQPFCNSPSPIRMLELDN